MTVHTAMSDRVNEKFASDEHHAMNVASAENTMISPRVSIHDLHLMYCIVRSIGNTYYRAIGVELHERTKHLVHGRVAVVTRSPRLERDRAVRLDDTKHGLQTRVRCDDETIDDHARRCVLALMTLRSRSCLRPV